MFGADVAVTSDHAGGKVFGKVKLGADAGTIAHSLFVNVAVVIFGFHVIVGQTERTEQIETVAADRQITVGIQTLSVEFGSYAIFGSFIGLGLGRLLEESFQAGVRRNPGTDVNGARIVALLRFPYHIFVVRMRIDIIQTDVGSEFSA